MKTNDDRKQKKSIRKAKYKSDTSKVQFRRYVILLRGNKVIWQYGNLILQLFL